MVRFLLLAALSSAALAQAVPPPIPNIDAARAAARQVDQATQAPRIGKESMDRVAPLLTVEPHEEPSKDDEDAWRKAKEAEAKKKLEASKPK